MPATKRWVGGDDEGDGKRMVLVFRWMREMGESRMGWCVWLEGLRDRESQRWSREEGK